MGEDGQMKEYPTANEKLTAVWKETVPVEKIEITNKVESLDLLKTLQLTSKGGIIRTLIILEPLATKKVK